VKAAERSKQKDGKAAFYHKRGAIAKEVRQDIADRKTAKMNRAQVGKAEARKERKAAQRERKTLPERR